MKAVLQRVKNAEVTVDGESVGKIGEGYMLLLGVMNGDTKRTPNCLPKRPQCCACSPTKMIK